MRKIEPKLVKELEADPFYKQCCITGLSHKAVKIDWHHNLIYGGKQVNAKFCILPLADFVHRNIVKHKEKCDWIMWNRATPEEIQKYSKAINYQRELQRLNKKYGQYSKKG